MLRSSVPYGVPFPVVLQVGRVAGSEASARDEDALRHAKRPHATDVIAARIGSGVAAFGCAQSKPAGGVLSTVFWTVLVMLKRGMDGHLCCGALRLFIYRARRFSMTNLADMEHRHKELGDHWSASKIHE